jgi:hypothetical protein
MSRLCRRSAVASVVPFWATATSARFYAPFLRAYLASLLCSRIALCMR